MLFHQDHGTSVNVKYSFFHDFKKKKNELRKHKIVLKE